MGCSCCSCCSCSCARLILLLLRGPLGRSPRSLGCSGVLNRRGAALGHRRYMALADTEPMDDAVCVEDTGGEAFMRGLCVERVKNSEAYRHGRGQPNAPDTPDPDDDSISKRAWEAKIRQWQVQLHSCAARALGRAEGGGAEGGSAEVRADAATSEGTDGSAAESYRPGARDTHGWDVGGAQRTPEGLEWQQRLTIWAMRRAASEPEFLPRSREEAASFRAAKPLGLIAIEGERE